MKNILRWLLLVLLVQMNCCASVPTMIINIANPLFQPKYQLVTYTGSLATPVSPQALVSQDYIFQSSAGANYIGFLYGSLVANGYSTNVMVGSQTPQTVSLGLSSSYALSSNGGFSVGLADLTELCQRYGGYIPFVTQMGGGFNTKYGNTGYDFMNLMTLPAAQPFKGNNWIGVAYVTYYNYVTTALVPSNNFGASSLFFSSFTVMPFVLSSQQQSMFQSLIKNAPDKTVFAQTLPVSSSSLSQFAQLQNWFSTNVNIQFSINGFASMPSSLMSMNGVTPTQPYNAAYKSMLDSLYKVPVSVVPTLANFVLPALFGITSVTQYNNVFGNDTFFVPLMMADPLWATAQVKSSPTASGFTVPYEYPLMKVYAWQGSNSGWTVAEQPAQKIGYAGDITINAGGGITSGTDFDPRKSPMSDFYSMLSF